MSATTSKVLVLLIVNAIEVACRTAFWTAPIEENNNPGMLRVNMTGFIANAHGDGKMLRFPDVDSGRLALRTFVASMMDGREPGYPKDQTIDDLGLRWCAMAVEHYTWSKVMADQLTVSIATRLDGLQTILEGACENSRLQTS